MRTSFITFEFPDHEMPQRHVHIQVEHSDLISALEIAQAYGGTLVQSPAVSEA